MRIKINEKPPVKVLDVPTGEAFRMYGKLFMKIEDGVKVSINERELGVANAVSLDNGCLVFFNSSTEVVLVKAEVTYSYA